MLSRLLTSFFVFVIFFLSACGRKGPGWADTIIRQTNQPNSIVQVDSEVVNFMFKYTIPGMSIAISKDGNMIYSKGYGFADRSKAEEVTAKTLFRIGRASELLTATAVMKLIGDGKLSLGSKVFGDSGILGNEYGALPYNRNITNVNVDQLLHHNVGGWSESDDPTRHIKYMDQVLKPGQLISLALENFPLRASPGNNFAFSDLGYLILGRIIEKTSGLSYSNFVKEKILKDLGISDMQIEGSSEDDLPKNETIHYGEATFFGLRTGKVDEEWYRYTALGDASYGWIASAEDLLKIITNLGDSLSKTPVLSPEALKMLLSTNKTNPHFGCGIYWNSNLTNWFDMGQFPGSTSEIAHASNGYCWVILINTYRPVSETYMSDMDQIFWNAFKNKAFKP